MSAQLKITDADIIRDSVSKALSAIGVQFNAVYRGETTRDGGEKPWQCDEWACAFSRDKSGQESRAKPYRAQNTLPMPYYMGLGHRKSKFPKDHMLHSSKPTAPHAADLIYSIYMDDTRGATFEEWASNFGYDTDSRKAMDTYLDCQEQHNKAQRFFGRDVLSKLSRLVEGY